MKVGVMQPYFLPYLGYFQLMAATDVFVIYDQIEFSKKGWIHRNRMLVNGEPDYFTLPLKKDSDYLNIDQRTLADSWPDQAKKLKNRISGAYRKAPCFKDTYELICRLLDCPERNLHRFILSSLHELVTYMDLPATIRTSNEVGDDLSMQASERVIHLCRSLQADTYVNPIGGLNLYHESEFKENDLALQFLKMDDFEYPQFGGIYQPSLSILDVLMFNPVKEVRQLILNRYKLMEPVQ